MRSVSGAGEIASRTMWRTPLAPPAGVPDSHEIAGAGFEQKTPQRPINTPRGGVTRGFAPLAICAGRVLRPLSPLGWLRVTRLRDPPALATVGPGRPTLAVRTGLEACSCGPAARFPAGCCPSVVSKGADNHRRASPGLSGQGGRWVVLLTRSRVRRPGRGSGLSSACEAVQEGRLDGHEGVG